MSCVGCETSLAPASPRMSKAELVDFDFERAPIYKSFVLDEERYKIGECIYVRGDDKAKSNEDWIAEILEIRAQTRGYQDKADVKYVDDSDENVVVESHYYWRQVGTTSIHKSILTHPYEL
ncbi:hypothetical protein BC936DRAFT_149997 [Jimgerdemannia flammicorona]|uniref:BAH domain-containing protein n=1 Tax=Jimgerdemannia flammicorona TaxID=994334 RepID=A0A433DJM4_9FUNG|nr:hypothetical protein BC936DRAFT_149997 [Jimgerdemannia flammicorona]